jgi:hypothetical protein
MEERPEDELPDKPALAIPDYDQDEEFEEKPVADEEFLTQHEAADDDTIDDEEEE